MGFFSIFNRKRYEDGEFNPEQIVGKKCVVTEKIDNFSCSGQVKVNGQNWSARGAYEGDCFEVGDILSIVAVEGVRLVCVKNQ